MIRVADSTEELKRRLSFHLSNASRSLDVARSSLRRASELTALSYMIAGDTDIRNQVDDIRARLRLLTESVNSL